MRPLPGADVDAVADAVGSDSRIGRKYLRGAVGYGGPCFPRDNIAFAVLAERIGARADLARATDAINRYQIDRLAAAVTSRVSRGARVAVLGMSYKPDTVVIEESQGVMLAQRLHGDGYRVTIHDPLSGTAAAQVLPARGRASGFGGRGHTRCRYRRHRDTVAPVCAVARTYRTIDPGHRLLANPTHAGLERASARVARLRRGRRHLSCRRLNR